MTYTVIGRCARTNKIGLGLATFSVAFGSYTQGAHSSLGIAMSQAFGRKSNAPLALKLMEQGYSHSSVLRELLADDPDAEYRQIGVMDRRGNGSVKTGDKTAHWRGERCGQDYLVFGNALEGEQVVAAMEAGFLESADRALEDRLIHVLERGRDAGGQRLGSDKLTERSACLVVVDNANYADWDLRVDFHPRAVDELRRIYEIYKPYQKYYAERDFNPRQCLTHVELGLTHCD